ncbi:MAG: GDP-fucose synthetase [Deltaproteobacteria bacterium HGW-Deltaproteobacteria-14]|jgi:GDP-L-fucose synthase|nr:MAG: GDP-fucose synthetase [Deltaproteobacteria bacterium HGW-Deltaproteobacteria-14]
MSELDLRDKRVCVTGGAGFLGSYVIDRLHRRGCTQVSVPRKKDFDLRDRAQVRRMLEAVRPDVLIHLAAVVGGIGANRDNPGSFFFDNLVMGAELIDQARLLKVPKVVTIGTICAYPKHTPVPFHEDALWDGYPEETNAPYGIAKKALLVMSQAYRQQYGMNAIYLLPVNLYGPRDNFDPASSHVIPALIKKCIDAREAGHDFIEVWGDGSPSREFLHARDAAEGIVLATERYDDPEPVNLGTGEEITIKALAELIAELTGYDGELRWNPAQPNGQPRRRLSTERALDRFGFRARTALADGLKETIVWYEHQRAGA